MCVFPPWLLCMAHPIWSSSSQVSLLLASSFRFRLVGAFSVCTVVNIQAQSRLISSYTLPFVYTSTSCSPTSRCSSKSTKAAKTHLHLGSGQELKGWLSSVGLTQSGFRTQLCFTSKNPSRVVRLVGHWLLTQSDSYDISFPDPTQ